MRAAPSHGAVPPVILAGLLLVAGCGGGDLPSAEGWTTSADTTASGVVHVVHTPPADELPTWTLEPELRIGAMDGTGPDVFGRIADIDVASDGRIAVLDAQAQELRLFAPDGSHLRTFGGDGGGPGEFRGANGVVFGPDGIMRVPDALNTRLSLIHPDSGFVRSHRFQPMLFRYSWDGVVDSAGSSWSMHAEVPATTTDPGSFLFLELAPDGTPGDTIRPEMPEEDEAGVWRVDMPPGYSFLMVPNYPSARYIMDTQARLWTTAQGDPAYRLVRWTAEGDTALVLEVARAPVPTDWAQVDSVVSGWEERFDVRLDRSKIPPIEPAIRTFFFDRDGRLWVHRNVTGDSPEAFDAFDADSGAYLGTLTSDIPVPLYLTPAIRGDMWWVLVLDDLDVPGVVRARMRDRTSMTDD